MTVGYIFLMILILCAAGIVLMPLVIKIRAERLEAERQERFRKKYKVYYLENGGAYDRSRARAKSALERQLRKNP